MGLCLRYSTQQQQTSKRYALLHIKCGDAFAAAGAQYVSVSVRRMLAEPEPAPAWPEAMVPVTV